MPTDAAVIWFEGMTLDPHHFQQWDRHVRSTLDFRMQAVGRFGWGFTSLEIDAAKLANGQFSLHACSGITLDGVGFDMPAGGPLPASRTIQDVFPPTQEKLGVYLALPLERRDGGNVQLPGAQATRNTRYAAEPIVVVDQNTGADEREVEVAKANFQIRFSSEPNEDYAVLKMAEVMRTSAGKFVLDDAFVPPVLSLAAAETLVRIARRITEMLAAKSSELWHRRQDAAGHLEMRMDTALVLLLARTVNAALPLMQHHIQVHSHPEALFVAMLSLAGQLSVFPTGKEVHPRDFPAYAHDDLGGSFLALDTLVRDLLERALPEAGFVAIALERRGRGLFVGRVQDERLLRDTQLFLVSEGEMPERLATIELPQKLRVASPDQIEQVLRSYTRALPVSFVARPPLGLPARAGMQYYRLEKQGPFWEAIVRAKEVAIFLPAELPDLDLQLVAVRT